MAEIVNLRMARKARTRRQAEQNAAENRAKFGRTKAEKERDRIEAKRAARTVDNAHLDKPEDAD